MGLWTIPKVLVPGTNENVNDLNTNFTDLRDNVLNGHIDATNLDSTVRTELGVNGDGVVRRGVSVIGTTGTRTNTAYGALSDGPDQVANVAVPANGKLLVSFQGTWQESVLGAARAAIFIGANQAKLADVNSAAPGAQSAATNSVASVNQDHPLCSCTFGLVSVESSSYAGDVTTGQIIGLIGKTGSGLQPSMDMGGAFSLPAIVPVGGVCEIFVAAGTYTISIQYKSSSGTVTVKNRKLWVEARGYV